MLPSRQPYQTPAQTAIYRNAAFAESFSDTQLNTLMPFFSVIIPLYNKAPYVAKTIESVLRQTFSDYELMVIDNGSTDGSGDIVAKYSDPRLQIHRIEENAGVSNARNKGVELTSAPYITFLDADDWWEPSFLEEMARLIEKHPSAGIYGTSYYIVKNGDSP